MTKSAPSLTPVAHLPLDELRACLSGLAEFCSVDRCNPVECPLFALRTLEPADRLRWFNALSEDDLSYLAAYHHVCMSVKLRSHAVDRDSQS